MTAPAFVPLPPFVEVSPAPTSIGAPSPAPLRPEPGPLGLDPPPTDGGGGTTPFASRVPLGAPTPPPVFPVPPPAPESDGGGGTIPGFPRQGAAPLPRVPVPPFAPTVGGGATAFVPSDAPAPLRLPRGLPPAAAEPTDGGGGTTSLAPKILPIKLLIYNPLPDCDGGGGTTVFPGSCTLPLARRRMSGEISEEGGGATTEGDGSVSLGLRKAARSGADTGGGTTVVLVICTGALVISRLKAPGAGGITFADIAGLERAWSRATLGAGATTEGSREREE